MNTLPSVVTRNALPAQEKVMNKTKKKLPPEEAKEYREIASEIIRREFLSAIERDDAAEARRERNRKQAEERRSRGGQDSAKNLELQRKHSPNSTLK
jgi:cation transport regulator ChaB